MKGEGSSTQRVYSQISIHVFMILSSVLFSELTERRIEGNIEEIKANQHFIRHSNFNLKIGETVKTKIHLIKESCDGKSTPNQACLIHKS